MLGFPLMQQTIREEATNDLLQLLIGGGPTSRLFREVREDRVSPMT